MINNDTHLKRALNLAQLILFGITYMTVITVCTTYGEVNKITDGKLPLAYLVALITMIFTAFSYGIMAKKYPYAGSAYTYSQKSFGFLVGFIVGWVLLLDYIFLPMINFMVIGIYLQTLFPWYSWKIFMLLAVLVVFIFNALGIKMISKVSAVIIFLSIILVLIFMALSARIIYSDVANIKWLEPFIANDKFYSILSGASVLSLSFLGFDAVSTLSEEAKNPQRNIPLAIVFTALIGGALFVVISWFGALAWQPDWVNMDDAAVQAGGREAFAFVVEHNNFSHFSSKIFIAFFVLIYVFGAFGSAMTSQASAARVLYVMGRDNIMPSVLANIWKKQGTPIVATGIISIVSLAGLFMNLGLVVSIISFGALFAFVFVNASVVKSYLLQIKSKSKISTLYSFVYYFLFPSIGLLLTFWLWMKLSAITLIIGATWLSAGLVYIACRSIFFKRNIISRDISFF